MHPFLLLSPVRFKAMYFLPLLCLYICVEHIPDRSLMPTVPRIPPTTTPAGGVAFPGRGATQQTSECLKKFSKIFINP
jgi:hypothetical protein